MIIKVLLLLTILVLFLIILKINLKKENFRNQICGNFKCVNDNCSITKETQFCNDSNININSIPNCYYNKVVNPNDLKCIDFCAKTYTWKDGTKDSIGNDLSKQFIESKKFSYFSSKCNECIENHYDRIKILDIDSE